MSYVRRVAVLASAAVAGALLTVAPAAAAAPAPPAAPSAARPPAPPPDVPDREPAEPGPPEWVGTYQLVARDVVRPDGSLRDVYDHRLVVGGTSYRLRMPKGTRLTGGTPVRVRGRLAGQDLTADEVTAVGAPARVPTTGTTKVLVILAYWDAPDALTVAQARNQVFNDDHGWYTEASYGQLGLTGDVTGWHKISAPTPGRCYDEHLTLMSGAKAQALAAGYDPATYGRTILYFPQCSGDADGVAGWAYMPGTTVWLNGYFDRRVSTHEQGHNYGLPHAHTMECSSGGARTTITGTCGFVEYGDDYDAMGASGYAAHFSAPQKDRLGWLGTTRKVVVGSAEQTLTLPPFERTVAPPVAAVATASSTRKYWVEYRQPVGYDDALPPGATNGVLVRAVDTGPLGATGPLLLDVSPQTGWHDAVIPPGGAWTSPEGIRISVGTVTPSGAAVTIAGGAQPPAPPSAPRNVTATGGDGSVRLAWDPPESNGGATVGSYVVVRTPGNVSTTVTGTAATVGGLANGTEYAFTVAARNAAGTGVPSAAVTATPAALLPSVAVTAPADGAALTGPTTFSATAAPHPASAATISYVAFSVDGQEVDWDSDAPYSVTYDPIELADGPHVVTATAYDTNGRSQESAPVSFTATAPRPAVAITSPAAGAVLTENHVELTATSAPAPGTAAAIERVTYELADGTVVGHGPATAPHSATWDTSGLAGEYALVAKAYDADGRVGVSAPVAVTVRHPLPSVVVTAPAEGATVSGAVTLAAAATPNPDSRTPVSYVVFQVGGTPVGYDYEAPFAVEWDSAGYVGEQVVTAVAYDDDGFSATSPGRTVFLAHPLPSVTLTSPAPGASAEGPLTFTAVPQAHPDGDPVARVEFTVDEGVPGGAVEAPGPYTVTWDPGTYYGAHTVVATVYDTAGRPARSAPVAFTVPEPAPVVSVTSPANGATVRSGSTTFTATAGPSPRTGTPVYGVEFLVGDLSVGWDDDGTDGWSAQWDLSPGAYTLLARAYDDDGYRGDSAPVALTVADPPDAPTGVTATAGADGTATVSWTAPAGDGGRPVLDYVVRVSDGTERVASGSPAGVSGLANGTGYTFQVKARTAAGFGPLSVASAAVTPGTRVAIAVAVNTTAVSYGRSVTVTGTLTAGTKPVAGKTLRLLACPPGSSTGSATGCADTGRTAVTSSAGTVSIAYAPKLHRDLRLRYVATGDRYLAATSAAKKVSVAAVVSSAISRTSIVLGKTVTVSGRVAPAHGGKRVYLQRLTGTGWTSLTYRTQTSTGYAAFSVKPAAKGTWRYRLYFPADTDHLAGYSPSRSVTVTAT